MSSAVSDRCHDRVQKYNLLTALFVELKHEFMLDMKS